MSPRCSLVCAMLLCASPALASDDIPRVRGLEPEAAKLIDTARNGSATVRQLIDRLQRSDLITLVQIAARLDRPRAVTTIIATSAKPRVRYALIVISRFTSEADRFMLLGHELQHAVELAGAPDVLDEGGLRTLYERIGWRETGRSYETSEALRIGRVVQAELWSARSAPMVTAAKQP